MNDDQNWELTSKEKLYMLLLAFELSVNFFKSISQSDTISERSEKGGKDV